ncbi:MAG: S9 family peptidase, partial [Planctomycetaceae bacterium]|nr:S9 family peptidase [Planctomycetaceae bacterium]
KPVYPLAKKVEQVDDYHGTKVADPYRWLEDIDSEETNAWTAKQNEQADKLLHNMHGRNAIHKRVTDAMTYETYSTPSKVGGRYYYSWNDGTLNYNILYVTDNVKERGRVLFDPNTLSDDGSLALGGTSPSPDGRYWAYALTRDGSDWREWHFRDMKTGEDVADTLTGVKWGGPQWLPDDSGFYYNPTEYATADTSYTGLNRTAKIRFHKMGTPQAEDKLVYEWKGDSKIDVWSGVSEDGKYLFVTLWDNSKNKGELGVIDRESGKDGVQWIIEGFDAQHFSIGNDGTTLFVQTDVKDPNWQIVAIDLKNPARENWRELLPKDHLPLDGVSIVGRTIITTQLKDALSVVKVYGLDGKFIRDVKLPNEPVSAYGFGGRMDDTETFFSVNSYTKPPVSYRYDTNTGDVSIVKETKLPYDVSHLECKRVFYPSKDGTKIPMAVMHKKGIKLDGSNPVLLDGYGGFNSSETPVFAPSRVIWADLGVVLAFPCLRGGGEYGESWHRAGMREKKQNVFDDFIGAAEWLIAEKYTSAKKVAIIGGSNGGLLVGACVTQRPELFGAAIPQVGVLDMLRFHKFTAGAGWVGEYGCADVKEDFAFLYKYSPLHNVKKGTVYPPTLIGTGAQDDRVTPAHSFKFAAAMQEAQGGSAPILLKVYDNAGHGMGSARKQRIERTVDTMCFCSYALGFKLSAE